MSNICKVQINNGYKDCYYITEKGDVYNKSRLLKGFKNHEYRLYTTYGTIERVSLKRLYRLVFNKDFYIDEIENLDGEVWVDIKNTKGEYKISNKGRIKRNRIGYYYTELVPQRLKDGYYIVDLYNINISGSKTKRVHKLVAEAFLENPNFEENKYHVHHKDRNRKNNCVDNLVYMTESEHMKLHSRI